MQFLTQLCLKKKKLLRQHTRTLLPVATDLFMGLLLSSYPLLCMVSEIKGAVDHTTWETFPFLFQQHCAKVMIANFSEIRQNSRISIGITGKFRCIYYSIVREISRNETNCHCENSFRPDENLAQNE